MKMATPYVSPLMATLKKDNSVRLCLDARYSPYPVEEIFKSLKNVVVMSSIDFTSGYYQILLTSKWQKYTGFKFDGTSYCFRVLPFGLAFSVSAFTGGLSKVFGPEFDSFLIKYIDDLLVVSDSIENHLMHLDKVFTRLKAAGFTLRKKSVFSLEKRCHFWGIF